MNYNFWRGRSVFVTGHTGFKGGWMALWLSRLGAKVYGYSLEPPTNPCFFNEINLIERIENSSIGDINNFSQLSKSIQKAKPSIIIHMAAQPLVRESYKNPVLTYSTNIIGTVNLFDAARKTESVRAIVNVTTDKCYKNNESKNFYHEDDILGGDDPYSSSKACSEIISNSYRNSFLTEANINLATARAGNVIGGGDWSKDRLIADFFRAASSNKTLLVRYPNSIRPWQHVLEPLSGYLMLAEKLVTHGIDYAQAWNFGPEKVDHKSVSWVVDYLSNKKQKVDKKFEDLNFNKNVEAGVLQLDSTKAKTKLHWQPIWSIEDALDMTIEWNRAWEEGQLMIDISSQQIEKYEKNFIKNYEK